MSHVHNQTRRSPVMTLCLLCLTVVSAGCRTGERDFSPDEVAQMFYDGLILYSQEQFEGYQEASFALLCAEDQKHLISRADALNKELPDQSKIKPHQLIVATSPIFGSHVQSAKVLSMTDTDATVELVVENGKIPVRLVREDSRWRIDLPGNLSTSATSGDVSKFAWISPKTSATRDLPAFSGNAPTVVLVRRPTMIFHPLNNPGRLCGVVAKQSKKCG